MTRTGKIGAWLGSCFLCLGLACGEEPYRDTQRSTGALETREVRPLATLRGVPIPEPRDLDRFIRNRAWAVALGKALFWDMQVGSDGIQACASCHFHAGTDTRRKGVLNPGSPRMPTGEFSLVQPNGVLDASHFPTHRLADVNDRASTLLFDSDDVVSSPGVVRARFLGIVSGEAEELFDLSEPEPYFVVGGVRLRQVEPRNTPSVINAIFNHRNFWDGRAQAEFNGQNLLGDRDPTAVVISAARPRALEAVKVSLDNASLASQALGPPTTGIEMSFNGLTFPMLGRKLLRVQPLAKQKVSRHDSVLGRLSAAPRTGLRRTYQDLIKKAFHKEWWAGLQAIVVDDSGQPTFGPLPRRPLADHEFWLMEYNFALFFGLAIQMYEATLVSDDTPLDRYLDGDTSALSAQELRGKALFEDKGRCIQCHGGAEMTDAAVASAKERPVVRSDTVDGRCGLRDNGFFNIGVRPNGEDSGIIRPDPFGSSFSLAALAVRGSYDPPGLDLGTNPACDGRFIAPGVFKTPGLRNIELTAPYFHNGGQLTLRQVIEFYNRGGDFTDQNAAHADVEMNNLDLTSEEIDDLVAFMLALTDERVRHRQAPFDHPQLFVPNGHVGDTIAVEDDGRGIAVDEFLEIPAVGASGGSPLPNFLE